MLTLNTNLCGLIAQSSLKTSTFKLNQAIERMTTGYKINHAADNAANYSISTNMSTEINAYRVAEDNASTGIDMLTTASDTISLLQDKASRLAVLSTQARNGTYGAQSLEAINGEANAIVAELTRLYSTTEFNGVKLLDTPASSLPDNLPKAGAGGFIAEAKTYTDDEVTAMKKAEDAATTFTAGNTYSISSVDGLKKLADFVNDGNDTTNMTFVLGDDIDMSSVSNWTPIGNDTTPFKGTFDGNGHVINKLKIDNASADYIGLFGYVQKAKLQNVGLTNADIKGRGCVGVLFGRAFEQCYMKNCYATGNVIGNWSVGILGGEAQRVKTITNCYATGDVSGQSSVAGLFGNIYIADVLSKCYTNANVRGTNNVGGIVGWGCTSTISNSYVLGTVNGNKHVGGIIGYDYSVDLWGDYATCDVSGNENVGGIVGFIFGGCRMTNCTSSGKVEGNSRVGGLVGENSASSSSLTGSKAYGTVIGTVADKTGGLIGFTCNANITDCGTFSQDLPTIGGGNAGADLPAMSAGINTLTSKPYTPGDEIITTLQVGINGSESSRIEFSTNFSFDFASLITSGIESEDTYTKINDLLNLLSNKSTELGAVENRLESVLDEISIRYDNLVSSRSTLRDADIAEVSSTYIQQQILQQASATLLATANQSPNIALQLI